VARRHRREPPYKDVLFVAGVLLIALGIGNWVIGAVRTQPHAEYLHEHPGPRLQPEDPKAELLLPPDEERQQRDVARAKLEFYQLVQSGGRFLVLLGCLCLLASRATRQALGYPRRPRSRGP
jgi:hypothetical protein